MEKRYYNEYFRVPADYTANMTREAINKTPDTWLEFYPHVKYLNFLNTLFDESKSVWLTGNYGTGKSNAALVTHKLFMDNEATVEKWFNKYANIIPNCETVKQQLFDARHNGTLVVYDYNASGVTANEGLLVRLEKGLVAALNDGSYFVPAKANLDMVIERLCREGDNFFRTRDSMLGEMKSLKADIVTVEQLIAKLQQENISDTETPTHFLDDVQAVLHRDNIYLNIDVPHFRLWVSEICKKNKLHRIIYIFDEFSDFIDENSNKLKTFEDVTEAPNVNHFYLVPVTHKELNAFMGENSPGAKKAKDRFYFRNLQMPNDIAFRLAASAMVPIEIEPYKTEWEEAKDLLWSSIVTVVDMFKDPESSEAYVARESFRNILPIHPMAAFLLKFLAESARSNQRSIFEYLKGSADGREFQEFIAKGGPLIRSRQFLTVDYLWKYFIEREDEGESKEISSIKLEYDRIKSREFLNYNDEQSEIRVLKAVMLFALLSKLNPNGHDRLRPTVENIQLSFRGDGVIVDVDSILRDLADNRHCFSIANGNIDLYATSVGSEELEKKKIEYSEKFHELLSEKLKADLETNTKSARSGYSSERFEIKVSDVHHTSLTYLPSALRDRFSTGIEKDDGSVCLWFVVAKNKDELLHYSITEKQDSVLRNLRTHRIIMISFPEETFCKKRTGLWDEYVSLQAQYSLENNSSAKGHLVRQIKDIEDVWFKAIHSAGKLEIHYYDTKNDQIQTQTSSWSEFKTFLSSYTDRVLPNCPDSLTNQIGVFSNKQLKSWVAAGIRFSGTQQAGQFVSYLKSQGVDHTDQWFTNNPNHVFSNIRSMLENKYATSADRGSNFSLRNAYETLRRAPYGLRYNCLSAFTLGFCMKWVLERNCQWTNGQLYYALDEDTLVEIIEAAVSQKNDKEKLICKLSEEDKAFAEKAGCMFGLPLATNASPLQTLSLISATVEKTSFKVPLWVLSNYVKRTHPEHELVSVVLDKLCIALKVSSKGSTGERAEAISTIGSIICNQPNVIDDVVLYTKPDVFILSFREYVDIDNPYLVELAKQAGDSEHAYCDLILNMAAPVSGWLWNQSDISSLIKQAEASYHIMVSARPFLKINEYVPYPEVLKRIKQKIESAGIPSAVIGIRYPAVQHLYDELTINNNPFNIDAAIQECSASLEPLFNDPAKEAILTLIRDLLADEKTNSEVLISIIAATQNDQAYDIRMTYEQYASLLRSYFAKNKRNTIIQELNVEWSKITGYPTVIEWSQMSKLPGWTVFSEFSFGQHIIKSLISPESYATEVLKENLEIIKATIPCQIEQCQKVFLETVIPLKYRKLNIDLASLQKYLRNSKRYGSDPNNWPEHPNIDDFVIEQYKEVYAARVVSSLQQENPEELKRKIIDLAAVDPDIGLRFLEL